MLIETTSQGEFISQIIIAQITIANIYKELMQRVALIVSHALNHFNLTSILSGRYHYYAYIRDEKKRLREVTLP